MLKDIDKNIVDFVWNFDDIEKEFIVLLVKYFNLLVNGLMGILVGYVIEIFIYNLVEIIDGIVYLIDYFNVSLEKLMEYILGLDFLIGGIL